MSNWTAAEIIMGIAVLALAMPREDVLLIPERRDWLAPLRRFSYRVRRRIEEAGQREADEYVAALRAEPETEVIRRSELPRAVATIPVKPLGENEKAPWAPAEWAPDPYAVMAREPQAAPVQPEPPKKREAPTIVMEAVRPEIERGLRPYLDGLPSYKD